MRGAGGGDGEETRGLANVLPVTEASCGEFTASELLRAFVVINTGRLSLGHCLLYCTTHYVKGQNQI